MFLCKKGLVSKTSIIKCTFFYSGRLGSNVLTLFSVYICIFLHNSMSATLCLHFPPVICLCSAHDFPGCQKMGFSKPKEIRNSLLSK